MALLEGNIILFKKAYSYDKQKHTLCHIIWNFSTVASIDLFYETLVTSDPLKGFKWIFIRIASAKQILIV